MRDLRTEAMFKVLLVLDNGTEVERSWTMFDEPPDGLKSEPPEFLDEPHKLWEHPRDPIVFTARVSAEHKEEALAWLETL